MMQSVSISHLILLTCTLIYYKFFLEQIRLNMATDLDTYNLKGFIRKK